MSAYRAALLALFVVGGALVAAVPASAVPSPGDEAPESVQPPDGGVSGPAPVTSVAADERVRATGPQTVARNAVMAAQNASGNNSSLGADISSFMQSSAAEVGGAVDTGMWTAAYNSTDNQTVRARLVERQTGDLREELAELRERKAELVGERNATNVSDAAYKAKLGQLVGRIHALQAAINATAVRAEETDTNVAAVAELKTEADNLTGPEIAAVARNITGVAVGNGQRGPPGDAGNDGNANGNGNGNAGASGNANGNAGNGNANGNGNADGNGQGIGIDENETTVSPNGTSNVSQRGPPAHANTNANAAMSNNGANDDNGANDAATNASAPATPPVTVSDTAPVGYAASSTGGSVSPAAAGTATDLLGPVSDAVSPVSDTVSPVSDAVSPVSEAASSVSDALAVRTYAFSHAPGSL